MELPKIYCQICATSFSTQFESWEKGGVVCSDECWVVYEQKRSAVHGHKKDRRLNIAELDSCPSLDPFIQEIESIPDLLINRYFIPPEVEWVFRGPPGGWPAGHGLDFPIATLITKNNSCRAYGLANVVRLLEELTIPDFAVTRAFNRRKARAFAPTKAMKRPKLAQVRAETTKND